MSNSNRGVVSHSKPNPSESRAVAKNKHCPTELRLKTGGDRRETHNFSDAFESSQITIKIGVYSLSRLLKKPVKLLIFIKDAFLKPTPTSLLPAEVFGRKKASCLVQYLIRADASPRCFINKLLPCYRTEVSAPKVSILLGAVCWSVCWRWRSGALPLDPPTDSGHALLELLCSIAIGSEGGAAFCVSAPQPLK